MIAKTLPTLLKTILISGTLLNPLFAATNIPEAKFLEKDTGKEAMDWAEDRTQKTKGHLKKNPSYLFIKKKVQEILYDQKKFLNGGIYKGYVYNFWTDDKNPQGLWRRTSLQEYSKENPCWEVLIDFDALSRKMGKKVVFRGSTPLYSNENQILISMSLCPLQRMVFS